MSEADEPKKKQARLGHEESDQVCAFAVYVIHWLETFHIPIWVLGKNWGMFYEFWTVIL